MVDFRSEAYLDQVIEAAFLHSKPNCFFVGPFARRVSFASQQLRALDLVRALDARNRIPKLLPIAVVGAGLAGVTAAAALAGLGRRVDLFDSGEEVLSRQRGAKHRLIHPTISRWPMEELSLTTELPFFDWGVSTCDVVLAVLSAEWHRYYAPGTPASANVNFEPSFEVASLVRTGGGKTVTLQSTLGTQKVYPLAIIATGYGAETGVGGIAVTSYWTPDELERKRSSDRKFVVGGCGDGGLVDALRLAHGDFNASWLAFALAGEIDRHAPKARETILSAEHDALMNIKSIHATGGKRADMMVAEHEVQTKLFHAYKDAAARLPVSIADKLSLSLSRPPGLLGRIKLVSPAAQPTTPFAAPIHKLLIVHAIHHGYVEWISGTLKVPEKGPPKVGRKSLAGHEVIQRVGSTSGLKGLLDTDEEASLQLRQLMLADRIETGHVREARPPPGYPVRNGLPPEFIRSRHRAAGAVVDAVDPRFAVSADDSGFGYHQTDDCEEPRDGSGSRSGIDLPDSLFGIPARSQPLAAYDLLA